MDNENIYITSLSLDANCLSFYFPSPLFRVGSKIAESTSLRNKRCLIYICKAQSRNEYDRMQKMSAALQIITAALPYRMDALEVLRDYRNIAYLLIILPEFVSSVSFP